MNKLLPCPFCGHTPQFMTTENHLAGNGHVHLYCCVGMEEGFILPEHKPKKSDTEKSAIKRLIKVWNKRVDG